MCQTTTNAPAKIHPFEAAGLGQAPFRYVGCFEDRGPHRSEVNGVECWVGAPGQPMGTCQYCGQGIAICCRIESADGKSFIVGSDCVLKTTKVSATTDVDRAHALLVKKVNADKNARARDSRKKREHAHLDEIRTWLDAHADALKALPNPRREGETLWDQVVWFRAHAGYAGMSSLYKGLRAKLEA